MIVRFITKKKDGIFPRANRLKLKIKRTPRPTSYPVVTGDSFRAIAKHIHDETGSFIPGGVSHGNIVFVSQPKALRYLQEIHPDILVPYILIVHNGDQTFDNRYAELLDEKIIHCFAQNVSVSHEKITPLPIGLSNFHNFEQTDKPFRVAPSRIVKEDHYRINKIFWRFADETCPSVRKPLRLFCEKHPLMETTAEHVSQSQYINLLKNYKFVIAPRGNAIDTLRPFESFHLGLIPIALESVMVRSLYDLGLPYWILKDWIELNNLTEVDLEKKYLDLMSKAKFEVMHMDYWIAKIRKYQQTKNIENIENK